jgi:hypothetical protein
MPGKAKSSITHQLLPKNLCRPAPENIAGKSDDDAFSIAKPWRGINAPRMQQRCITEREKVPAISKVKPANP